MADWNVNPWTRDRLVRLVAEHPGSTSGELVELDGGGVLARMRVTEILPLLRSASRIRRDAEGRWWPV